MATNGMRHTDGNPMVPCSVGGIIGRPPWSSSSLIYIVGEISTLPFYLFIIFNCLATQGYVSSKKVVSSRESEARSLFEGDWKQRKAERQSSSGRISFCHLTSGLNWRGLALVQSTLDAKWVGIWKPAMREKLSSFMPHGLHCYRQRGISLSKYSGCSSSSYYWTFITPFSWHPSYWVRKHPELAHTAQS